MLCVRATAKNPYRHSPFLCSMIALLANGRGKNVRIIVHWHLKWESGSMRRSGGSEQKKNAIFPVTQIDMLCLGNVLTQSDSLKTRQPLSVRLPRLGSTTFSWAILLHAPSVLLAQPFSLFPSLPLPCSRRLMIYNVIFYWTNLWLINWW